MEIKSSANQFAQAMGLGQQAPSGSVQDVTPPAQPQDNLAGNSAPGQTGEQQPAVPPVKDEPQSQPTDEQRQEHDWQKRYEESTGQARALHAAHTAAIEATAKLVESDSTYLSKLAEIQPEVADEVAKKLYGKTYSEYQEEQKIQELKDTNPKEYETETRLKALERELEDANKAKVDSFLATKNIIVNQHDAQYIAVKSELSKLDPKFLAENPVQAWEAAYAIYEAKSGKQTLSPEEIARNEALAKNTSPASRTANDASGMNQPNDKFPNVESKTFYDKVKNS